MKLLKDIKNQKAQDSEYIELEREFTILMTTHLFIIFAFVFIMIIPLNIEIISFNGIVITLITVLLGMFTVFIVFKQVYEKIENKYYDYYKVRSSLKQAESNALNRYAILIIIFNVINKFESIIVLLNIYAFISFISIKSLVFYYEKKMYVLQTKRENLYQETILDKYIKRGGNLKVLFISICLLCVALPLCVVYNEFIIGLPLVIRYSIGLVIFYGVIVLKLELNKFLR